MEPPIVQEAEREMRSCPDTKQRPGTTETQKSGDFVAIYKPFWNTGDEMGN